MELKNILMRPTNLYEALLHKKLVGGGGSETIIATDYTPYLYRSAPSFGQPYNRQRPSVVGGSLAWNQLANPSDYEADKTASGCTYEKQSDGSVKVTVSATLASAVKYRVSDSIYTNGHKYLLTIGGNYGLDHFSLTVGDRAWSSIAVGANGLYSTIWNAVNGDVYVLGINARIGCPSGTYTLKPQIIDLTALFGSTVADAIYAMEQSTAGSGVAFFKNLFRDDYFPFNSGELMSVQTSAHVIRDANDTVISNYALDPNLVLRGVPKWENGQLKYDGDIYHANGTVERRFAERPYESGDESLADAITDGTTTVYKLTTPTTESATPYTALQMADPNGTEEWVSSGIVPVGQETEYISKS